VFSFDAGKEAWPSEATALRKLARQRPVIPTYVRLAQPITQAEAGRGSFTDRPLNRHNVRHLVRLRAKIVGISLRICNHTFRVTGINVYPSN
jgi:hypothetical protein